MRRRLTSPSVLVPARLAACGGTRAPGCSRHGAPRMREQHRRTPPGRRKSPSWLAAAHAALRRRQAAPGQQDDLRATPHHRRANRASRDRPRVSRPTACRCCTSSCRAARTAAEAGSSRAARRFATTSWRIVVRTASRRVLVYHRGRLARTFVAIVGKPSTPTPHGLFFVEESVRMPAGSPGGAVRPRAQRALRRPAGVRRRPRTGRHPRPRAISRARSAPRAPTAASASATRASAGSPHTSLRASRCGSRARRKGRGRFVFPARPWRQEGCTMTLIDSRSFIAR